MGRKRQIVATVVAVAAIAVGLYFVNRFWIAPVKVPQHATGGKDPVAPAFAVTDLGGQKLSLASFRGKVVLLNFWGSWCGPCRDEIPGFVRMQQKYGPQGFQIIGIAMDDNVDSVRAFYAQHHMNYPVAMGNAKLGALYGGIYGFPTSFLIGRDGHIYDEVPGEVDQARWEQEIQSLLAVPGGSAANHFKPDGKSAQIGVETPAEVNSEVPGVDLSKLSKAQVAMYKYALSKQKCTCGCSDTVLQCRIHDTLCATSRDMAKAQLAKMQKASPGI